MVHNDGSKNTTLGVLNIFAVISNTDFKRFKMMQNVFAECFTNKVDILVTANGKST